jgi:hypothetical protein
MLHRVALIRTNVWEERSSSIIRLTRIGELGTTLAVTSNRSTLTVFLCNMCRLLVTLNFIPISTILVILMMEALRFSETLGLTRGTPNHIQEENILHN